MSDRDWAEVQKAVEAEWDTTIIPALSEYIEIPSGSPDFDPEWATNGLIEKAFHVLIEWMKAQNLQGLTYEFMEEKGRTPFLIAEIAGTEPTKNTVLMYGHMDKQPPLRPWAEGLDPHKAVLREGKLYGRGGADDGYAIFSAITSVSALQRHGIPHGRVVVVIEACEESGSFDLDYYMERCKEKIGNVDLMVCLDSGAMNYDQVWLTTSLRGVTGGVLNVQTLTEGMHSGVAGGVVPDTFRIARELLDRIESSKTGEVLIPEAHCAIPDHVVKSMEAMRSVPFKEQFATVEGVSTEPGDNVELALRNAWKPSLTVVGANLPEPQVAGNVIRTVTSLKLSLRVPPLADAEKATQAMKRVLEADPPYGAKVWFESEAAGDGCATPELTPWLARALNEGSTMAYGRPVAFQGMGGAIPFIAMLVKAYPQAQFIVTGVLGPKSNAHGPNEFLHIKYAKGLTFAVSRAIAEHFLHTPK
ncbi:putative peptidase M20/M25/M40 [Leptomonas pyrrhocoris]|uniref:Putative peptidase M20/M25/M40 n=1 Tax=Leptomonas pyrrhocoris TaxID=157538 RepID=A0A0M9G348_LEPPY|nr:putative peptidase M20/M25/M40 [Leptomonas pyrrhocoris]KPA81176.1 putative peptidase M20/M25/M40 [Leptomonas pyrrhocoris]|eukprot:XP_015659615.1 putative peptidase M20/M25/M40 [Leptomonas pyrrhocoris]